MFKNQIELKKSRLYETPTVFNKSNKKRYS